jgi:hypothetical protein
LKTSKNDDGTESSSATGVPKMAAFFELSA